MATEEEAAISLRRVAAEQIPRIRETAHARVALLALANEYSEETWQEVANALEMERMGCENRVHAEHIGHRVLIAQNFANIRRLPIR